MEKWFITGTDTDVGKTYVGQHIMQGLAVHGLKTVGFKPISAGCENVNGQLVNDDAEQYRQNATLSIPLREVNPVAYEPPIAPHIAAAQKGEQLSFEQLVGGIHTLEAYQPDVIVTEGAGGWKLPMGEGQFLSSFPVAQEMKVILVVGLRLGCLNHALLTAESIKADGATLAGWIGNHIDPDMLNQKDNIDTLADLLGTPLAIIPHKTSLTDSEKAALVAPLLE